MTPNDLPPTTLKLIQAAQMASDTTERSKIDRVIIRDKWKDTGIFYEPAKNRWTSREIERAGISELVTLFCFDNTRHLVEKHFRPGVYDISGKGIKIIE